MISVRGFTGLGASCLLLSACFVSIADLAEQPAEGGSGGGGTATCAPGTLVACYDGPPETLDVGVCTEGATACEGSDACAGQVLPSVERCTTDPLEDEDCDGADNDHCAVWNVTFGGSSSDVPLDVEILEGGDALVTGNFGGTMTLGGRPVSAQGSKDGFVARFDGERGALVASLKITGLETELPQAIAVGAQDDVFVGGGFTNQVRIGGITRTTTADQGMFMARLDLADLSPHWLLAFGTEDDTHEITAMAAASGGAIIGGELDGTVALGGGVSVAATQGLDAFIARVDVDGIGVWGYRIGGPSADRLYDVVSDGAGSSYVAGAFTTSVDVGCPGDPLAAVDDQLDAFILKIDEADGACLWSLALGGDGEQRARGLAIGDGVLYALADFEGSVGVGRSTVTSAGSLDLLAFALDPGTGGILWHRAMGDASKQEAWGIAHDPRGGVGIAASIQGQPDFGSGPLVTSGSGDDAAVIFLSATGEPRWSRSFGDGGDDDLIDLAIASNGDPFLVGEVETGIDLGLGFIAGNKVDVFVARLDGSALGE